MNIYRINTMMYSDWASLSPVLTANIEGQDSNSVLGKLTGCAGRDVAFAVVKQLAGNLGIAQAAEPSSLATDQEVHWCMEVICYGLSLPLSEHDTIRDCVNVYCEWLTALHPSPKISVPKPVCNDANIYARRIIKHFHNLFVPRPGEGGDVINRQAVLCHRVLRTLQHTAQVSTELTRDTWEALLLFLLAINEILLAPPTIKDDVGDQLCERVLSVLFEVWLLACVRCFPSPSLWKTLRESCMNWRHRVALIEQWNRINLALTARLLEFTYGPSFPELKVLEEDAQLIPLGMSNDCVAQSWFRFLHTLGSPAALCRPREIADTPRFIQFTISNDAITEPCQHPCLRVLPAIFVKAVKGVAGQVDAFLGIAQTHSWEDAELRRSSGPSAGSTAVSNSVSVAIGGGGSTSETRASTGSAHKETHPAHHNPTPPSQRRLAKSFSVASGQSKGLPKTSLIGLTSSRTSNVAPASAPSSGPSSTSSITSIMSLGHESKPQLAAARPRCNSILHLFGEWLFEAAHVGSESWYQNNRKQANEASKRPSSMMVDSRKGNVSLSQPPSLNDSMDLPSYLTVDKYESGRAEAIGALSRIFCAKKTGEEILPVYLARYYLALQQGLVVTEGRECGDTMASILLNSADLFRLDLDGVQILVPAVINALETVLPDKDLKLRSNCYIKAELRRSSIHLLISMLALPLHFQNLPIRNLIDTNERVMTFAQFKPRLMNLLINALQVEWDSQNAHMLLGGLLLCVQDSAVAETMEGQTGREPYESGNLLSSACSDSACSIGSANSSAVHISNEYRSLSGSEEYNTVEDVEATNDSAHALFVRATYLVCHRLISTWKTDLNVSLAALELLTGLARIHIRESDALECKRAVKWICDFVSSQCSRPPPAHSKDLHSGIVAAYQCLSVWLVEHPNLLSDKDCLHTVMEVVELGISGSKSMGKPGEPIKMKDEKELKPVSMRVRDAAENLLTGILEQVGYFPSPCGAQSLSSLLDEPALLKQCNSWKGGCKNVREAAIRKFRYFVVENSTLLALLEEPLGNDQDPQPTVTALVRGPSGRHAWSMQLRHLPRSKSGSKAGAVNPGRPVPMSESPAAREPERHYFPEGIDRVPACIADQSIPALESLSCYSDSATASIRTALSAQIVQEKRCWAEAAVSEQALSRASECRQPKPKDEFQTARLFLAHFGFLDPCEGEQEPHIGCNLVCLDASTSGFITDLQQLDAMSSRTCDTVHVFYVRSGQRTARDIAANADSSASVSPHYLEALRSLGWPVKVSQHAGWTGHATTSWRNKSDKKSNDGGPPQSLNDHGGALYNGDEQVLYWADASTEIAFVVPTNSQLYGEAPTVVDGQCLSGIGERSISESSPSSQVRATSKGRAMSLDSDKVSDPVPPQRRRTGGIKPTQQSATKMLLIWLESYEDHLAIPIDNLLAYTSTGLETGPPPKAQDALVIFFHALDSGLLRVHLQGPVGRISIATPLIDGMVISRRVVGPLVRQTALNMARRRRLDNDSYQPPHVRRRFKVQEIVQKYRKEMSHPELLTHLFYNPSS